MTLNTIVHEKARLRIIAALASLKPQERVDFTYLKNLLDMSDGNLSTHLRVLEREQYIEMTKTFVERKPKTFYWLTVGGREAFAKYIDDLQQILFAQNNK